MNTGELEDSADMPLHDAMRAAPAGLRMTAAWSIRNMRRYLQADAVNGDFPWGMCRSVASNFRP